MIHSPAAISARPPGPPGLEFVFPPGAAAEAPIQALRALWAAPVWAELAHYTLAVQANIGRVPLTVGDRARVAAQAAAAAMTPLRAPATRRRYRADVLVAGECVRAGEIDLMGRLLLGLVRTGRSVLYLTRPGSTEERALRALVAAETAAGQVQFLAPWREETRADKLAWYSRAVRLASADWRRLGGLLAPLGLHLGAASFDAMIWAARSRLAWTALGPQIDCAAVVLQHHVRPLAASIAADLAGSGRPIISCQQGVISLPVLYAPVPTSHHLCFGAASQRLLSRLQAGDQPARPTAALLLAGSLIDRLMLLPPGRDHATLLVIDQSSPQAATLYGIGAQFARLVTAVRELLARVPALRRVVVRLHPDNTAPALWQALAQAYPGRLEIAGPQTRLEDDLAAASAAVGLFSGALATAAACGVPTFFLWEPGWFYTPDLAGFAAAFVSPEALPERVARLLSDATRYADERAAALDAAADYYAGRSFCTFDEPLVRAMLAPTGPVSARAITL